MPKFRQVLHRGVSEIPISLLDRFPTALRASASTGLSICLGLALGDLSLGLLATMGAFTSLYAADRPYFNRAIVLAAIACSLAIAASAGVLSQSAPWVAVPLVILISAVATFLCNSLRIGPPGAYMPALTAAASTAIPVHNYTAGQVGLVVLAGGVISWAVHMIGALLNPRGPETLAVSRAAEALAAFLIAGNGRKPGATASALHSAWIVLVTLQPRLISDRTLAPFRAAGRELNLIFASSIGGFHHSADTVARVREIGVEGSVAVNAEEDMSSGLPIGGFDLRSMIRQNLSSHSPVLWTSIRVAIAVALAGLAGAVLGVGHSYWAMAAAVLIAHQGAPWKRTLRRGTERVAGTFVGLLFSLVILTNSPQGLLLLGLMVFLQFIIELFVVTNYTVATVFITVMALTIASGGHQVSDPIELLTWRGVDTFLGCVAALLVQSVGPRLALEVTIPVRIASTIKAVRPVVFHIAMRDVSSEDARFARRDLQSEILALEETYEAAFVPAVRGRHVRPLGPVALAAEKLAYKALAICWLMDRQTSRLDDNFAIELPTPREGEDIADFLDAFVHLLERPGETPPVPSMSAAFRREIEDLRQSLTRL